ncbi:MAG TPA: OmpA family protein [Candidatus Cybelea sp.]|nr:OmpA family protein [Candidatus Cybelea sp.]
MNGHRIMRIASRTCVMLALLLTAAACGTYLQHLQKATPTGSPFAKALAAGYRALSEEEAAEYDWPNSRYFARKGLLAAQGQEPPAEIADEHFQIPDSMVADADTMRVRLITALEGGREAMPEDAARAQVAYDCWLEEASEPNSGADQARCRNWLNESLAKLAQKPAAPPPAKSEAAPAEVYVVFFDFNKSEVTTVGQHVLDKAIADFRKMHATRLDLSGHTDLSGNAAYNIKLSERRADAVKRYLLAHGVKDSEIRVEWFGKSQPRVATADSVRNQENRRVEITLQK